MSGYGDLAYFYDSLTTDAEYDKRVDYLLDLFKRYDSHPSLMLDLACGTGNIGGRIKQKGIDVIGVDCSEDMLALAQEKYPDMLLLCQDATELELYGTVDGAVCCLDSLNHICNYADFCRAISKVALFLEPERLFIFDVNTEYKHSEILGNNTIIKEYEDLFCIWQNSTENGLTEIDLDIFALGEDSLWERYTERIIEKAYSPAEIEKALADAGFQIIALLDDMKFAPPQKDSQRVIYVTKRIEKQNG